MPTIKIRLNELLEAKMKREGRDPMTHEELAHTLNISRPTVATYLKNRLDRLDKEVLIKMCLFLECEIGDLLVLER